MKHQYVLYDVKPDEYSLLKEKESKIIKEIKENFNDVWRPRVKDVNVSFKYNSSKNNVGIFIDDKLILNSDGLDDKVDAVVGNLYHNLSDKLDELRLISGTWE